MGLAFALVAWLSGSDIDRLGSDSWRDRERAEARLRAWWVLAVPFLAARADDPDPEIRHRVGNVLGRWRSYAADLRAAAVLLDPWPVDPVAFYRDRALRERVQRLASEAWGIVPDVLIDDCVQPFAWWGGWTKPQSAAAALEEAKRRAGVGPGWPFK